jgi:hypothetical protein
MIGKTRLSAADVRARLAFDVERLRAAAMRLDKVDAQLSDLKAQLVARARVLAREASGLGPVFGGDGSAQIRTAQAQATAHLARRAALGDVLRSSSPLSLIVSMATSRWVGALRTLHAAAMDETALRSHVDAGRVAHRLLSILRPKDELRSGTGQLVSAVVIAEFAHPANEDDVCNQIEEGLDRARSARGIRSDEDAINAASRALRAAAELLETMADRAEPDAKRLATEADTVEAGVESDLRGSTANR